jgi:hypothetical protein
MSPENRSIRLTPESSEPTWNLIQVDPFEDDRKPAPSTANKPTPIVDDEAPAWLAGLEGRSPNVDPREQIAEVPDAPQGETTARLGSHPGGKPLPTFANGSPENSAAAPGVIPTSHAASANIPPVPSAKTPQAVKPSNKSQKLRIEKQPIIEEETVSFFTPEGIKGFVTSIGFHAALLVILALWIIVPQQFHKPTEISTKIGEAFGNLNGIAEGTDLGRVGDLDAPLNPNDDSKTPTPGELTKLDVSSIHLDPAASVAKPKNKPGSAGAGLDLSNIAGGGGGSGEGFGIARYGNGKENIGGVEVKVGDPQFTLIWDAKVDLDLHVFEPGGKEIWWLDKTSPNHGEIDVDNTEGFGPENIYWTTGKGPPGVYKWYVHYYPGFGGLDSGAPVHWKVRIKHAGTVEIHKGILKNVDQRSKLYTLKVERDGAGDDKHGESSK